MYEDDFLDYEDDFWIDEDTDEEMGWGWGDARWDDTEEDDE